MNPFLQAGRWIFKLLCSLRFAVMIITGIAGALAAGTFLESYYDTKTASYFVYRAPWFQILLLMLGANIFCVALSRWPWTKKHIPFLLAHVGILMLLAGSLTTQVNGLDGSLRLTEGDSTAAIDFDSEILAVQEGADIKTFSIPWTPPVAQFRAFKIPGIPFRVVDFMAHAETVVQFESGPSAGAPALQLRIKGGPMKISQEFWLWGGDPGWSVAPMGPARFILLPPDYSGDLAKGNPGEATLYLQMAQDGGMKYQAISRRGEIKKGIIPKGQFTGAIIDPGWMGVTLTIEKYVPNAQNRSTYKPSRIQYGDQAPPSALRIEPQGAEPFWIGLGDQISVKNAERQFKLIYTNRRVILPFALKLERFQIDHYEGSADPMSYSSLVKVDGANAPAEPIRISMNEPLHHGGYTFYQASYVPEQPRPTTSILSVNYDPGRFWKYLGSLLIVLGSILLFVSRGFPKRKKFEEPKDETEKGEPK